MPGFTFITGGARSGKSAFAQGLAEKYPKPWIYLATAEALDGEMEERIAGHRSSRPEGWETVEEPRDVHKVIEECGAGVVLLDCVTLWITNLMAGGLSDKEIRERAQGLATLASRSRTPVLAVSNEVGSGIVPDNPLARRFRDLAGTANQMFAKEAHQVWFLASGIPLKLK